MLVTSLKDGMNLVAKEFCAAQVDEAGVVVISEFTGAAAELKHGAIVVNPNDLAGIAEAIHRACVMPVEEKRSRMRLLRDVVRAYNVESWAEAFLVATLSPQPIAKEGPGPGSHGDALPLVAAAVSSDQQIA
jgi:trehalose 6-phosphate synthase